MLEQQVSGYYELDGMRVVIWRRSWLLLMQEEQILMGE
jgi:hypothetical protein